MKGAKGAVPLNVRDADKGKPELDTPRRPPRKIEGFERKLRGGRGHDGANYCKN